MENQYELDLGAACERLLLLDDFKVFLGELKRLRELATQSIMFGMAEDYPKYMGARGEFVGYHNALGVAERAVAEMNEMLEQAEEQSDE